MSTGIGLALEALRLARLRYAVFLSSHFVARPRRTRLACAGPAEVGNLTACLAWEAHPRMICACRAGSGSRGIRHASRISRRCFRALMGNRRVDLRCRWLAVRKSLDGRSDSCQLCRRWAKSLISEKIHQMAESVHALSRLGRKCRQSPELGSDESCL